MINNEIDIIANEMLTKYLAKGNSHKILQDIMVKLNIKFKDVNSKDTSFVGALSKGNNGQDYIFVNSNIDNIGRKNFTISHELGHYFLRHQLMQNSFYCEASAITEEGESSNEIEREADHFASCFLMPENKIKPAFLKMLVNSKRAKIKDFLHVKNDYTYSIWAGMKDDLAKRYGVSEAALRYRLAYLKIAKFDLK